MQDEFLVHTREGEPCLRCGETIRRVVVAGRSTYFCPGCQRRLCAPGAGEGAARERASPAPPDGFLIGHWTDPAGATGCTVVIAPPGARGGVDVRGGGPGTRETDVIGPLAGTGEVTAVLLTGGSAFGLAAADGVVGWLEEHGRGYETPAGLVPIVPAAVIYDLATGDPRRGPTRPPGYAACEAAAAGVPERGRGRRRHRGGGGQDRSVASARTRTGIGYAAARTGLGDRSPRWRSSTRSAT